LDGATAAELLREQVRQLRDSGARQKRLENLLVVAYRALPQTNHLDTIPGFGEVTAAVLTAFTVAVDRFATPGKYVAYFGVLPTEVASGVERDGQARAPRRWVMSRRGNDLVRRYLWMAASAPPAATRRSGPSTPAWSPGTPGGRRSPSATPCASCCTSP